MLLAFFHDKYNNPAEHTYNIEQEFILAGID